MIEEKDLVLIDLVYFSFEDFLDMEKRKAIYISRLKPNIAVYVKSDEDELEYFKNEALKKSSLFKRIDITEIMRKTKCGNRCEIKYIYVGTERQMKTRLILYKLTESQLKSTTDKSAKNAQKKSIKKSENTINLLGVSLYITNVDENILDAEQIHEFYSLRWQVEIVFKTLKSIFRIQRTRS